MLQHSSYGLMLAEMRRRELEAEAREDRLTRAMQGRIPLRRRAGERLIVIGTALAYDSAEAVLPSQQRLAS